MLRSSIPNVFPLFRQGLPLTALLVATRCLAAEVVITEIHYNPAGIDLFEFVELYNAGESATDLAGWSFSDGIRFDFASPTSVAAGGLIIVARSVEALRGAYPELPVEVSVVGDFEGALDNGGERLALSDAAGVEREVIEYDDVLPWDFLADGLGASLERVCLGSATEDVENWRASPATDYATQGATVPGGTPGRVRPELLDPTASCPPAPVERAPVLLSEVLYHAVLEEAIEEEYEFVELYNAGAEARSLAGWRLVAGIRYDFPDGAEIPPGGYLVIAKDPAKLSAVEAYRLDAATVLGPYDGTLDNGGDKVALVDDQGVGIDLVNYDDGFPWPHAADALGAGESWLAPELLPLGNHRHQGHSLERVSFAVPATEVANWVASPLDAATPGRPSALEIGVPRIVVSDIDVEGADDGERLLSADDDALLRVEFSPTDPAAARLEYFIEDLESDDEARTTVALELGEDGFEVRLPRQAVNTIVRYRVRIDRDGSDIVLSPRPDDPYAWHAYFVNPPLETSTTVYHVFISARAWGQLERNLETGRVVGCEMSPTWNNKERAVVVHDGDVFETQVRFQGSRWNRRSGGTIAGWSSPGPDRGAPSVRSWRLSLPRYNRLDGRSVIQLNKLTQACPGHNSGVGYRLFAMADLPSPETRYARLHINGGYYRYMMEYERPGEELIRRYNREMAEKYPERPREKVGHLFKSVGCTCDEGPFGWGDWRVLEDFCEHPAATRYAHTYGRKTHEWDGPARIQTLIEDMHVARELGLDANLVDALDVVGHLFERRPLECEDPGDIDDNGSVDVADALRLLRFVFARGDAPRPPFPGRGFDPTPDAFPCGDS